MKARTFFARTTCPEPNAPRFAIVCVARLLAALLLMALSAEVQAQFNYTTNNGSITITKFNGLGGAVTIPDTISGLPVTSLGDGAFNECKSLTSVTIPDSVTSIGQGAFGWCTSLTNVTIPNSVTSIGDNAFWACTSLTTVTIPDSVTNIGYCAFNQCTSLTSVSLGNSVTSIREWAFNGCTSLTTVTIPDSVTNIGYCAFNQCTSLTSVSLGNSVTNIGANAFEYCAGLMGVYFAGNAPSLGSSVFGGDPATLYYLPGTTGWSATFGGRPTVLWNPQAQNPGVRTNQFGFSITGTTNLVIVVEAATNLANPAWSVVGTNTLTGGSSYFSDPQWANYPARFYRLRSP